MRRLLEYGKQRVAGLLLLALCAGIFAFVLFLYDMPAEAVGYAAVLCLGLLLIWGAVDFICWNRRIRSLEGMLGQAALAMDRLPGAADLEGELYQTLLRELDNQRRAAESAYAAGCRETVDYYTMWVHQIKTPIAAMRLMLRDEGRDWELAAELFRVEQYVELVLTYLRLGSDSTDYVIREYPLSNILRQAVRKYAPLFIRGRVSLDLRETDLTVLTDEKWLQLVVEQVLSNAVKYAPGGKVTVYTEGERLIIEDNGVGISQEDLPRIFEKGFTGCNGRMDERSTGIGLYLCRQICRRLRHTITVTSEPGRGTRFTIGLARPYLEVE